MTNQLLEQPRDSQSERHAVAELTQLIHMRIGIALSPRKQATLGMWLRSRFAPGESHEVESYLQHLRESWRDDPEWSELLRPILNHDTWLFRDAEQWRWLREEFLPERVAVGNTVCSPRRLRVWSAATSSGDELYSVATCVAAAMNALRDWRIELLGTDLASDLLDQAVTGCYDERAMRHVPAGIKHRLFTESMHESRWQASTQLRDLVMFRQHNLLEPLLGPAFDLVLLKNVLIYFDRAARRRVLANVSDKVTRGGLLMCGPTEDLSSELADLGTFERVRPWLFRKI